MKDLRTEDEIIANWKGDIDKPVVSICCITYNHEPYIEDALKGFLIQETDFPFEILIHDDASTDRTADIIREYEAKYPRLIKPIYQVENQYSQGVKISAKFNFPRSQGKYIALCEGDDYWTSKEKLEKQYQFLEKNKEYSLCFHSANVVFEGPEIKHCFKGECLEEREYTGREIYKEWTIPTASTFFVNDKVLINNLNNENYFYGDIIIFLSMASVGKLWAIHEQMSVYRKHPGGVVYFAGDSKISRKIIKHHKEIMINFNNEYQSVSKKLLCSAYLGLARRQILKFDLNFLMSIYFSFKYSPAFFLKSLVRRLRSSL